MSQTAAVRPPLRVITLGTTALDTIHTPFGHAEAILGGSGIYAALAASFFTQPGLVSIVGTDLRSQRLAFLKQHGIDLAGMQQQGKTFRWSGKYEYAMNEAETLETHLNALAQFRPVLPSSYRQAQYVFLANIDPLLQLEVLNQVENPDFVMMDTMNYWITTKHNDLLKVMKKATVVMLNEGEARQLCDTPSLVKAAKAILELGPQYVIIKKGEHGALLFSKDSYFSAPAYPLEDILDPTGAGDSFAGALIGYLASQEQWNEPTVRRGIIYGTAVASFCVEGFGTEKIKTLNRSDLEERYEIIKKIREF